MTPQEFDTLVAWVREDLKRLEGKMDNVLSRPSHSSPCSELRALTEAVDNAKRGIGGLLFDLLKAAVIASIVALLVIWKQH